MSDDLLPPLRHPVARALLVGFVVLHVVLALTSTGPTPISLLALALMCGAAAAAVLPQRLPRARVLPVVLAPLVATGLVLSTLHVEGWPGYAAWPLGATTFVALALAVRGRRGVAWLLLAGLAAESVAWSLLDGAGPLPGIDLVVRHVGTLVLGTLFAVGLQRSAAAVAALHDAERQRRVERAAAVAAEAERRRAVQHLLDLVEPTLGAIEAQEPVLPETLRALEGRLRDEMTAAPLLTEHLNHALSDARRRGIDAVVLDDAVSTLPPQAIAHAAAWLADRVEDAPAGRFVARTSARGDVVRLAVHSEGGVEVLELTRGAGAAPPR